MTDTAPDTQQQTALLHAALAARQRAHAPYSGFRVGAAVLDEAARIHAGCNVENAAYPQGLCAEAVALGAMVVAGGRRARALLVLGDGKQLVTPCGGCRQKLREFADGATPVLLADAEGVRQVLTLDELLPQAFAPAHLEAR